MKKISLLFSLSLLVSTQAFAVSNYYYNCPHKDVNKTRVIEMVFHSELSTAPCEVVYHKPDKQPQVLWEAWNEEGYCETKGEAFAEKQKGWGWMCERIDGVYVFATEEGQEIVESEQDIVKQGQQISFEEALERRKIQLEIRGMQLEKVGLIKEARKKSPEANSSPQLTENTQQPSGDDANAFSDAPEVPEQQRTDWQKKMAELQKKKASIYAD